MMAVVGIRVVLPEPVESAMPWRGPCWLCGGQDARHRILDAIQARVRADDSPAELADDYDLPVNVVQFIAARWNADDCTWTLTGRLCLNTPDGCAGLATDDLLCSPCRAEDDARTTWNCGWCRQDRSRDDCQFVEAGTQRYEGEAVPAVVMCCGSCAEKRKATP